MRIMRAYLPWLLRLLGPALLLLFLLNSDLKELGAILWSADPWPIIIALILMLPFLVVKAWRWQRILRELGLDLPLLAATNLYTVGIYLASITPGQSGDLIKAWYLKERGQSLAPALLSVVLDRLFDMIVMAILAVIGLISLGQLLPNPKLQAAAVALMIVGLVVMITFIGARGPRKWVLTYFLPAFLPQRLHTSLERWNNQLSTLALHPGLIIPCGVASLLSVFFTLYRLWLLFIALDVHIPFFSFVGASALTAILQVLPISIAGVGVRDAVLLAIVIPYGYSQEQALSVSALFLFLTLQHILIGFIVSLWYPLGKFKEKVPEPQEIEEIEAAAAAKEAGEVEEGEEVAHK